MLSFFTRSSGNRSSQIHSLISRPYYLLDFHSRLLNFNWAYYLLFLINTQSFKKTMYIWKPWNGRGAVYTLLRVFSQTLIFSCMHFQIMYYSNDLISISLVRLNLFPIQIIAVLYLFLLFIYYIIPLSGNASHI